MSSTRKFQISLILITIYTLFRPAFVHAASIPRLSTFDSLATRDASTCGGSPNWSQCGGIFPSDFCCQSQTTCLQLNTSSSIIAAICCPAGQDCSIISPIDCDISFQNATNSPTSSLHASPPTQLQKCGTNTCCPMGYSCSGGHCTASSASKSTSPSSSSTTSGATSSPTSSLSSSTSTVSSPTASSDITPSAATSEPSIPEHSSAPARNDFSGKSFAAGFVPGIAIGVLLAIVGVFLVSRRRRRDSDSYVDEKHDSSRDTLTTLGPAEPDYRPTMHGRSISEPTANPDHVYRTDFLQSTPPQAGGPGNLTGSTGYTVDVSGPAPGLNSTMSHAQGRAPKVKAFFSRSPFLNQAHSPVPTQAPLPDYLKRGTVSYQINPVRGLKKQRSMHSLRRQVTDATSRSHSSQRQRQSLSRNGSTETIQVLMQTPDHSATCSSSHPISTSKYYRRDSTASWESTDNEDTTPIEDEPARQPQPVAVPPRKPVMTSTPTRPGGYKTGNIGSSLGTPYTPSNFERSNGRSQGQGQRLQAESLTAEREYMKRDTTFSAMMERAGFKQEDFMMSGGAGPAANIKRKR